MLVKDQLSLELALSSMSSMDVMQLWKEEDAFVAAVNKKHAESPAGQVDSAKADSDQYHHSVMVPWVWANLPGVCDRLYQLGTPSQLVEGFRTRVLADF